MTAPFTSRAMVCTAAKSPGLLAGKPASITSTPRRTSWWAISSFSEAFMLLPGDCSPSRRVVSKKTTGTPRLRREPAGGAPATGPVTTGLDQARRARLSIAYIVARGHGLCLLALTTKSWLLTCRMAPASQVSPPSGEQQEEVENESMAGSIGRRQRTGDFTTSLEVCSALHESEFIRRAAETVLGARFRMRPRALAARKDR